MVTIKAKWGYGNGFSAKLIGMSTYDQTSLQLFMWNNGTKQIIYNVYEHVFCPCNIKNSNPDLWSEPFTISCVKHW